MSSLNRLSVRASAWLFLLRKVVTLAAAVGSILMIAAAPAPLFEDAKPGAPSGPAVSIPAGRLAKTVAIITLREEITADTALIVKRRINDAVRGHADAIVFELDTPGGELGAVREICTAIKQCPIVNTVAWVRPQAYSGGAIIALACREIVVAEAGTMGDAGIIAFDPLLGLQKLDDHHRAKFLSPLMAEVVDSARRSGYDEKLVQGMVTLGVELWRIESLERPGETMFIDRAEYRIVFGEEPSADSPTIVGPPPLPAGTETSQALPQDDDMVRKLQRLTARRPRASRSSPEAEPSNSNPPAPEEVRFVPAGSNMTSSFNADVSEGLTTASNRLQITPAERGKWRLAEFVSDGRALYTFKQRQLFDYHLAARGPTKNGAIDTDEDLKAFFGASYLARLDRSAMEATAAFLSNWFIKALLIIVFIIGLFIELIHPGLIIPGSAAAVALLLLLAPAIILGLGAWWQVAAIVVGVLLLAVELFIMPGLGFFGILGLVSLFAGLVGTFMIGGALFPGTPESNDLYLAMATVLISCATASGVIYANAKYLGRMPFLRRFVLDHHDDEAGAGLLAALGPEMGAPVPVGEVGVAVTPLRPSGRVQFGDEIVDVVSESGYIGVGQSVRVTESSGYRVVVEPSAGVAQPGGRDGRSRHGRPGEGGVA